MPENFEAKKYVDLFLNMRDSMPLFKADDADQTVHLGRAFAHAVRDMREISREQSRPIRVGLDALSRTGKTTFVRGVLSGLANYLIAEDDRSSYRQATRRHSEPHKGWLRNYDASLDNTLHEHGLPSYLRDDISEFGLPFIDVVEHPSEDEHNTQFDCLLFLRQTNLRLKNSARTLSVLATEDIKNTAGYQKFIDQAETYKRESYPLPVWSAKP